MKRTARLPALLVAILSSTLATSAMAQDGAYVGVRGGVNFLEDTDFGVLGTSVDNEYDTGYGVAAIVGYARTESASPFDYRFELELGYQDAEIDSHTVNGVGKFTGSDAFGDTTVLYGFANFYADYAVAPQINVFAGGGVGLGNVKFDKHGVSAVGTAMDDSSSELGYHLDAGLSYDIMPNITLEAMYRWQSFGNVELVAVDGTKSDVDVDSHNLFAGLRYKF